MRRYTVSIDDRAFTIDVVETASDRFEVTVDDRTFEATLRADEDLPGAAISPEMIQGTSGGATPVPQARVPEAARGAGPAGMPGSSGAAHHPGRGGADVLAAPMPGVVLQLLATPGALLARGDAILVLEAMKMRNTIRSPRAAVLVAFEVEAGQPVAAGDPLVRLAPAPG